MQILSLIGGILTVAGIVGGPIFAARRRPRPVIIQSPTLGILDLSAGSFAEEIHADKEAIAPMFSFVIESKDVSPVCNVLFIYCHLEADGSIGNSVSGLREIVRDSGAAVVVVASGNGSDACVAAAKRKPGYGHANLVMTIDRRGGVFAAFFQRLFTLMKQGLGMPVAWVKLAPQIPGVTHDDMPASIFLCEAGQVSFQ